MGTKHTIESMIDPAEHIDGYTLVKREDVRRIFDRPNKDYEVIEMSICRFVSNISGLPITRIIHKTIIDKQGRHNLW